MDPDSASQHGRVSADEPRAGRRRVSVRDGVPADSASRWECLSELGPEPIRLTPNNTTVSMAVRWLGGLMVRGVFTDIRGAIHAPGRDASMGAVTVEIRADSVRTGISLRDRHLRGPLFLDAVRHPVISFRGGNVLRLATHFAVAGSLTIRGVTRTEELRCTLDREPSARELAAAVTLSRRALGGGVRGGLGRLEPLFVACGEYVSIRTPQRL
jgi:polyisoprenoid-binding protein YceI